MKKFKALLLAVVVIAAFAVTSCTFTSPINATSNPVGTKVGKAGGKKWFGIFYLNVDASIKAAAKKGKISKISTVDWEFQNYIIFQEYTCIITGE